MTGAEAEGRSTRVEVFEVIAIVRHANGNVLGAVAIGVADERGLPMLFAVL